MIKGGTHRSRRAFRFAAPAFRFDAGLGLLISISGFLAVILPSPLFAHPLAPSLLELVERVEGVDVLWKQPLAQPAGVRLVPQLPARCRPSTEPEVSSDGLSRSERWLVRCDGNLIGTSVGVDGLGSGATAVVRVVLADGRVISTAIDGEHPAMLVTRQPSLAQTVQSYFLLGLAHLLGGPDHLLFVFGLILLARSPRGLIANVSAFTVGHSMTLALATLGYVAVPTRWIELSIAASVLLLAVHVAGDASSDEGEEHRPDTGARWALGFGLLHGLGFAGALTEAGLPRAEIPPALFGFNLGIEVGQLLFVLAVAAIASLMRLTSIRISPRGAVPAYAMGTLAAFWFWQRLWIL